MATLVELCDSGELQKIDPGLEDNELPLRRLYGTNNFIQWMDEGLPNIDYDPMYGMVGEDMYGSLNPLEQIATSLIEFVLGERYVQDRRFKKLLRTPSEHIWELRTSSVRVFGWFPERDVLICCYGDDSDKVHTRHLFNFYMHKTILYKENLDLDAPKALEGERLEDVISN